MKSDMITIDRVQAESRVIGIFKSCFIISRELTRIFMYIGQAELAIFGRKGASQGVDLGLEKGQHDQGFGLGESRGNVHNFPGRATPCASCGCKGKCA
jgi:hypothetical protein